MSSPPSASTRIVFPGEPGSFVDVKDTVEAFDKIAKGEYDNAPEQAFQMCGGLDDVEANIKKFSE